MTRTQLLRASLSGVLIANSIPHLGSGVSGHPHLTPVRGRDSGPAVNVVWGVVSAAAGLVLLRTVQRGEAGRWDASLVAFEAGAAGWALWSVVSERVLKVNWSSP